MDTQSRTFREQVVECLRVARAAPRPGTIRHERLVERCVAERLRLGSPEAVEVIVIAEIARGIGARRRRHTDEPGDLSAE